MCVLLCLFLALSRTIYSNRPPNMPPDGLRHPPCALLRGHGHFFFLHLTEEWTVCHVGLWLAGRGGGGGGVFSESLKMK